MCLNETLPKMPCNKPLPFALCEENTDYKTAVNEFQALLEHGEEHRAVYAYLKTFAWQLEYGFSVLFRKDSHYYAALVSSMNDEQLDGFLAALQHGMFGLKFVLNFSSKIISDKSLPVRCRVRFWKLLRFAKWQKGCDCKPLDFVYSGNVFFDNPCFRESWFRFYQDGPVFKYIEATSLPRVAHRLEKCIEDAIKDDDAARLGIVCALMNYDLNLTRNRQLLRLLKTGAWECLLQLFQTMPSRMYSIRTPAQWMFTFVRNAGNEDTAVKGIREIESRYPGTVSRARDIWGNTLLWNTLTRPDGMEMSAVQNVLLEFGCPADCAGACGLSFMDVMMDNECA